MSQIEVRAITDEELLSMGLTRQEIAALREPKAPAPTDAQLLANIQSWAFFGSDNENTHLTFRGLRLLLASAGRQNAVVEAARQLRNAHFSHSEAHESAICDALDALEPKP